MAPCILRYIAIFILIVAVTHARPNANKNLEGNSPDESSSISRRYLTNEAIQKLEPVVSDPHEKQKCHHDTHCKHGANKFPADEISKYERSLLEEFKTQAVDDQPKHRVKRGTASKAAKSEAAAANDKKYAETEGESEEMSPRIQEEINVKVLQEMSPGMLKELSPRIEQKGELETTLIIKISGILNYHFLNGTEYNQTLPDNLIVKNLQFTPEELVVASRALDVAEAEAEADKEESDSKSEGEKEEISPRMNAGSASENEEKEENAAENPSSESEAAARSLDVLSETSSKPKQSEKRRRKSDTESEQTTPVKEKEPAEKTKPESRSLSKNMNPLTKSNKSEVKKEEEVKEDEVESRRRRQTDDEAAEEQAETDETEAEEPVKERIADVPEAAEETPEETPSEQESVAARLEEKEAPETEARRRKRETNSKEIPKMFNNKQKKCHM